MRRRMADGPDRSGQRSCEISAQIRRVILGTSTLRRPSSSSPAQPGRAGPDHDALAQAVGHERGLALLPAGRGAAARRPRAARPSARTPRTPRRGRRRPRNRPSWSRSSRSGAGGSVRKAAVRSPNRSSGRGGLGSRSRSPTSATVRLSESTPNEATRSPRALDLLAQAVAHPAGQPAEPCRRSPRRARCSSPAPRRAPAPGRW